MASPPVKHTEHCLKRQLWGDGECECGANDRLLAELRERVEVERRSIDAAAKSGADGHLGAFLEAAISLDRVLRLIDELKGGE